MRLSEAIRLGSMLKPQGFGIGSGGYYDRTCAIGAAYEAGGVRGSWPQFVEAFPIAVLIEELACPVCGNKQAGLIAHINDDHLWTRERIADWVESIENAQTTPAASREEARTQEHAATTAASEA